MEICRLQPYLSLIPSPKEQNEYKAYIGGRKNSRIKFGKYIESNCASVQVATTLTRKKPCLFEMREEQMAKNDEYCFSFDGNEEADGEWEEIIISWATQKQRQLNLGLRF